MTIDRSIFLLNYSLIEALLLEAMQGRRRPRRSRRLRRCRCRCRHRRRLSSVVQWTIVVCSVISQAVHDMEAHSAISRDVYNVEARWDISRAGYERRH